MSVQISSESDDQSVWERARSSAGAILEQNGPLSRLELLCTWALSPNPNQRRLAAAVLLVRPEQLGAETILWHLAGDGLAQVRQTVAEVTGAIRRTNPRTYDRLLRRLAADPDPGVRASARGG